MKRFLTKFNFSATLVLFVLMSVFVLIVASMFSPSSKTVTAETPQTFQLARWSQEPQIFGAKRGNPWINVQDGREILTDFAGATELRASFENNEIRPLSIATADFDEDGMPDIVIGYENGAATLMRGNVDAVYPNAPEAKERKAKGEFTDASFLSPAKVFPLPAKADFLAAGDFNADGHFDIAVAKRNANALHFLVGDGKGGFDLAKTLELEGNVTALLAEDFNRRDGTNDLIVGIQTAQKSQLLIFENPYGVMKAKPEVFDFNAPITSLAIGSIEGDARFDLAIAAGNEVAVLRGRDRKLLFDDSGNSAEVVSLSRRTFDFRIEAVAIGEFIKSATGESEVALLADDGKIHLLEKEGENAHVIKQVVDLDNTLTNARVSDSDLPVMLTARISARPIDTLVIGFDKQIHLLTSDFTAPRIETEAVNYDAQKFDLQTSLDATGKITAILPMRLNIDALSDLVVMKDNSVAPTILQTAPMATFEVDSTSLAADFENNGICCTGPVVTGICMGVCSLRAAIEQGNLMSGSLQINFNIQTSGVPTIPGGTYSILPPVVINGASQPGGLVEITGTTTFPVNISTGSQTDNCVFRGLVMNGVGGNYYLNPQGINNIFEGNRIGTNAAGTAASGSPVNNTGGIGVNGGNLIGGTTVAARNIISTGTGEGVGVNGHPTGNPLLVHGNFIGTDVTGTVALGNFGSGIRAQGENLTIGGTTAGAGNVISATMGDANFGANGISSLGGCAGCGLGVLIQGNRIGTNAAGTAALGNLRFGIYAGFGTTDTIGGTTPTARNIVSGNGLNGIEISATSGFSPNPSILGNFIGTNAAGSAAIPNGGFGLSFGGSFGTLVGNNVVSGNTGGGILFCCNNAGINDVITQNLIGTDATNTNPLGNGGVGLSISNSSGGATQSGTITDNTIVANGSHGILVDNGHNLNFASNFIGTNANGSLNLGNGGDGIRFVNAFSSNNVLFNRITRNAGKGVNLATENIFSLDNNINQNRIWDNGDLGIDLGGNGVTPNDNCDAENGTNNFQNYPVISSATRRGNNIRISGTLNSAPNTNYTLHLYASEAIDPSGFGEGQRSLGQTNITVPAGCQVNFTATVPNNLPTARCISATATDSMGNTSEFSRCVSIRRAANDFDGDGLADLGIFRPLNGQWWLYESSTNMLGVVVAFGTSTDKIVPADYDGDGKNDVAFWRPSTGEWFVLRSSNGTFFAAPFGNSTDKPAPGDFDGDGKDDFAVYRQSTGTWFILKSSDNGVLIVPFGIAQDLPVVADYDGDGISDIAIYRPMGGSGNSEWWILKSTTGLFATPFGSSTDKAVQADYTGDGKADVAFFRPSTAQWFILRSEDLSFFAAPFGISSDIPSPADYDGDGSADIAVFRPSNANWFVLKSTGGVLIQQFGATGDIPLPSAFVP